MNTIHSDLSDARKADLLLFKQRLDDLCNSLRFKVKVIKLQPTYIEGGGVAFSKNDIFTLVWDDNI